MKPSQRGQPPKSGSSRIKTSAQNDITELLHGGEKRFFRCPGVAAGCLRARRTNDRSSSKMGDSLIMDFGLGFFAIADSSGRSTGASRNLLRKFARMMDQLADAHPLRSCPGKVNDLIQQIEKQSQQVLQTMSPSDSSTFTGILIIHTGESLRGIVLHSGDSLLFQHVPGEALKQISRTNFWMLGRSSRLYQLEEVKIVPGTIFVLTTDGISDLIFPETNSKERCLKSLLEQVPVDDVPERLLREHDISTFPVDDLGIIVLKPELLPCVGETVMLSGTSLDNGVPA